MRPAIIHPKGKPDAALLVDLHSVVKSDRGMDFIPSAILIGSMSANGAGCPLINPVGIKGEWESFHPMRRGIYMSVSKVMLDPIRKAADRPKTRRSLRMNHSLKIK